MKPICITFAGPPGCSKSPVASYLSCELNLPILSTDVVRFEVKEDQLATELDVSEFERRMLERLKAVAARQQSFIYDASIDRRSPELLDIWQPAGYELFVISYGISWPFYQGLLRAKDYQEIEGEADRYFSDHQKFLKKPPVLIALSITDETFPKRLQLSLDAARRFIADKQAKIG